MPAMLKRLWKADPTGLRYLRFFSNHDEDRMISRFGGDERKAMLAIATLMTMPGVPLIYYGEEIGMRGEGLRGRNSNRRPMQWELVGGSFHQEVRRIIRLRRDQVVLRNGGRLKLLATTHPRRTMAWMRTDKKPTHADQGWLVAINVAAEERPLSIEKDDQAHLGRFDAWVDDALGGGAPIPAKKVKSGELTIPASGYRILRGVRG
jgi:glycosidase